MWFDNLPLDTAIKVRSAGALDAASTMRKRVYANATTIGALGNITGQRKQDVYWDLAHALILVASPPPADIAMVDMNDDEPPALEECSDSDDDFDPPCLAHCGDSRYATICSLLDPTLAGIARYELLEDRAPPRTAPVAPRPAAPEHDLIQARAEALLAACLSDDYLDPGGPAATQDHDISSLRPAAIFSLGTHPRAAASLPTSVRDAKTKPDYEGPYGWRAAVQKEVTRVHNFGAFVLVPAKDAHSRTNSPARHGSRSLTSVASLWNTTSTRLASAPQRTES